MVQDARTAPPPVAVGMHRAFSALSGENTRCKPEVRRNRVVSAAECVYSGVNKAKCR